MEEEHGRKIGHLLPAGRIVQATRLTPLTTADWGGRKQRRHGLGGFLVESLLFCLGEEKGGVSADGYGIGEGRCFPPSRSGLSVYR